MPGIRVSRLPTSRREFLAGAGACGSQLLLMAFFGRRAAFATAGKLIEDHPWGRLVELAEGIWAVASTPLVQNDWTTLCNGGIVAGDERVLVIESFAGPEGGQWVANKARELTGRWPTDVLVTHYHGDHANGIEGFALGSSRPRIWTTATTRDLIYEADADREIEMAETREQMLASAPSLAEDRATVWDLGGRRVTVHPRAGHTASDVTVELEEPSIVFCGDLVWNGIYPNYRDTLPTRFAASIRALQRNQQTVYVSGHGSIAASADIERLLTIVDDIERAARRGLEEGLGAAEAAAGYKLPDSAGDWHLFRETYFEVAITAWYEELGGESG